MVEVIQHGLGAVHKYTSTERGAAWYKVRITGTKSRFRWLTDWPLSGKDLATYSFARVFYDLDEAELAVAKYLLIHGG